LIGPARREGRKTMDARTAIRHAAALYSGALLAGEGEVVSDRTRIS
jgi:hypothetical protein